MIVMERNGPSHFSRSAVEKTFALFGDTIDASYMVVRVLASVTVQRLRGSSAD